MTKKQALKKLEKMSDIEFALFLQECPARVRLVLKGGLLRWQDVLPEWYIKLYKTL